MRQQLSAGLLSLALVLPLAPHAAPAQTSSVTVSVDVAANRRPIDPRVYGVAHASAEALADLNVPLNRWGGNNTTRYNWQQNADNRANDWYYESIAYDGTAAGDEADDFIGRSRQAGAEPMMTIPTVGWVAKLGPGRAKLAGFSQAKYGPQQDADWQWFPDAGNGVWTNGQHVTGNDPNDANVPSSPTFQRGWVQHLVGRWGAASAGGLRYYILDNEPSIWHATHRDVHPTGARMEEIRDKIVDYSAMVKSVVPGAVVVGPEEWGWSGYFFSGYDQQYGAQHGWGFLPDRADHGGWDYLPWLLDQLRQHQQSTGQRALDVFTVHYYPQGGEFSDSVSTSMQQRRNRSTRSLWDPTYTDETWIADEVRLIPRLREWVDTYYPGTQIGLTEYNWGAEGHINGATAQADVWGIFGREGLDVGARWTTPDSSTPTYKAMKLYRNYDGNESTFGNVSVRAAVPNPDDLSAFAAERSADGALTVMVVNKALTGSRQVTVNVANFAPAGVAQVWQLTDANRIDRLADVAMSGNTVTLTVPRQSVTLLVLPSALGGADTAGVHIAGTFFLRNTNGPGQADAAFRYGPAGASWKPIKGDWDGNGTDTVGLYDPATGAFFLRNANGPGAADLAFTFGPANAGFLPLSGDWDGDGDDTVGLYSTATGTFFLKNGNAPGAADLTFRFGAGGGVNRALAGDWDGDGADSIGIYNTAGRSFFLKNANAPGAADRTFVYGGAGATPVAGDWDADGDDTIGVYYPSTAAWFLRNTNSGGAADLVFTYGPAGATPMTGNWNGG
jgi:hypothetical protein